MRFLFQVYLPLRIIVAGLYLIYRSGVPLINFVDDMIDNHLLVGITRAANTVMMVGAWRLVSLLP